jgi:hypothetical protein
MTFVGLSALSVVIATAACSVPALRGARLDPLTALGADETRSLVHPPGGPSAGLLGMRVAP